MERDVNADEELDERTKRSAERAIRALLLGLGFTRVYFVDTLPASTV